MQIPLTPRSSWAATPVHELPLWPTHGRVAVDCETRDPQLTTMGPGTRRDAYIVGISFAIEDGPAHYLPIAHEGGGNLDPETVLRYVRDQAARLKGDLAGAKLDYDLDMLAQRGVRFRPRRFRDCLAAEPLLDENQFTYGLDAVAGRHGLPGKSEEVLLQAAKAYGVHSKADLWRLHARFVGEYGERDVRLPLDLLRRQERRIEEQDLERVWDIECRVLPVLMEMRRRGVRIDFDHLARVEARCREVEAESTAAFGLLCGKTIQPTDIGKAMVVGPMLEAALGIKLPRVGRNGNQPQVAMRLDKQGLIGVPDGPVANALMRARRFQKLRTTFVASIRDHAVNGRVHCTFLQMKVERDEDTNGGTVSGRLSSCHPNLQQQPGRDPEIGPFWRAIYLPDEGKKWACLDYSGQEIRWAVHLAALAGCTGAEELVEEYKRNIRLDAHQTTADKLAKTNATKWAGKDGRTRAKAINLGLLYGMGGAKLARSINLPTEWREVQWGDMERPELREMAGPEAQAVLDDYFREVPWVKQVARAASKQAERVGFVRTALGRRGRFEAGPNGRRRLVHKALNKAVQGTSADQVKKAMVEAEDAGIALQLQVHDELDLSVTGVEEAERLAEIMRAALPCKVPHLVEPQLGDTWGACK